MDRTLRGDRLTTEQTSTLRRAARRALGDGHPYTRAVRLKLAATLAARGATSQAALRSDAEHAARALVGDAGSHLTGDYRAARCGCISRNAPEREGFRRSGGVPPVEARRGSPAPVARTSSPKHVRGVCGTVMPPLVGVNVSGRDGVGAWP
jgi:hypothetical protein